MLEKLKSKRVPHYEKKFGQVPMVSASAGRDATGRGGRRRGPPHRLPLPAVRCRGAVCREEGGPYREALRLPPGDFVQFLPPQVPVSETAPGHAAGSAGTDVSPPRRAGSGLRRRLLAPRPADKRSEKTPASPV